MHWLRRRLRCLVVVVVVVVVAEQMFGFHLHQQ
jgi:hypothetical protein